MSELVISSRRRETSHWQLLTSVSVLALSACISSNDGAWAESDGRPTVWIELGAELDHVGGQGEAFSPAFLAANTSSSVLGAETSAQAQKPPAFGFGGEGTITIRPERSDWVISAGVRYGRSTGTNHVHHQTYNTFVLKYKSGVRNQVSNVRAVDPFSDTHTWHNESHAIIDFQVGQDVGLGMFGKEVSSTVSMGVRFAQFQSASTFDVRARPIVQFYEESFPSLNLRFQLPYFHTYHATEHASRNFHGLGPSIAWKGSAPLVGNLQDDELTVDWSANAAVLFGKQRTDVQHLETAHYVRQRWVFYGGYYTAYPPRFGGHHAARSATIPNVGGSLGLSWRVRNLKASVGYQADFFFNAVDQGLDVRKPGTLSFHGPYASISLGLGG